jgi:hypothetical protein
MVGVGIKYRGRSPHRTSNRSSDDYDRCPSFFVLRHGHGFKRIHRHGGPPRPQARDPFRPGTKACADGEACVFIG